MNVCKMQENAQAATGQSEDVHAVSHKSLSLFVTDVVKLPWPIPLCILYCPVS